MFDYVKELVSDFRLSFRACRRKRVMFREFEQLKANVLRVGQIIEHEGGKIEVGEGWTFDCSNGTPVSRFDAEGKYRFCGYTNAELREIYARRKEWA